MVDPRELSTELDYIWHFQGKVSLIQVVISWFRGENRRMNTNQETTPTNCYACEWSLRTHQHTCEKAHPPVTKEESADGNEWRWDSRPASTGGQVYRIWHRYAFDPTDGYLNCVHYAVSREAILK